MCVRSIPFLFDDSYVWIIFYASDISSYTVGVDAHIDPLGYDL